MLPREFDRILSDIASLCDAAETRQLSILDMMTPVNASPLVYAFPSVYEYTNACHWVHA